MAQIFVFLVAKKLCAKQSRARERSKNAKVKNKQQLVDNRDTRHLLGAYLSHHYVIEQADKVGNAVLNDNGYGDRQKRAVKRAIADKLLEIHKKKTSLRVVLSPIFAVEAAQLNGLCHMRRANGFGGVEVGNGAGYAQNAVIAACAQSHAVISRR